MDEEITTWINQIKKILLVSLVIELIGLITSAVTGPGFVRVSYGVIYFLALLATIVGLTSYKELPQNFSREVLYPAQHAAFMNFAFALSILLLVQSPLYRYKAYFAAINILFALILGGTGLFTIYRNRVRYNVPVAP